MGSSITLTPGLLQTAKIVGAMSPRPFLAGTLVIELGEVYSAPFAGKLLADLGADVIKIESLPKGDPARSMPPFARSPSPGAGPRDTSLMFAWLNANKRSVALNLRTITGRKLLKGLLAKADIFLHNKQPKDLEALGLTYEELHAQFPRLVVASVTPYGQTGPYRNRKAYPSTALHMTGASWYTPQHVDALDEPPLSLPGRPAAVMGGLAVAMGALTAIVSRKVTGQGSHVDVSETESVMPTQSTPVNRFSFDGMVEPRNERIYGIGPFDFFRVKDGWTSIFLVQDAHWNRLVKLMGDPDWSKDPIFKDRRTRAQYKEDVTALMQPWLLEQTNEDFYVKAQAADLPIGPARTIDKTLTDPQFVSRRIFRKARHPATGDMAYLRPPYLTPSLPWQTPAPSPRLGQHTSAVLMSTLGLSRRQLTTLAAQGVIA
ncbi:MAG: CoA transferase [Chloroflexi bacterium]|nr:CoA transferase [Chloroflexota bacterium]